MKDYKMKIGTYFFFILLLGTTFSCEQSDKKEPKLPDVVHAKDLINRSIGYHDPESNWKNFKSSIQIQTVLRRRGEKEEKRKTELFFENQSGEFGMHFSNREIAYAGKVSRDTCYNRTVRELSPEVASKYNRILNCEGIKFYKDYYSYLLGLPMKLLDKEAIVLDSILERTYNKITYDVVKVNYEPIKESHVWYFYFNKKNHAMELCKFTSLEDEHRGGEYIIYNQEKNIQGMKLKGQQVWLYNTPELDTLAVSDLQYILE